MLLVIKFYLYFLYNFPSLSLSLLKNVVSSRMNPSWIVRDICLACFNNLNLPGLNFQDKFSFRGKKERGGVRVWGAWGKRGQERSGMPLVHHRMFRLFHQRKGKGIANCLRCRGLKPTAVTEEGIPKCWLVWPAWVCAGIAQTLIFVSLES